MNEQPSSERPAVEPFVRNTAERTPRQQWLEELALADAELLVRRSTDFVVERHLTVEEIKPTEVGLCLVPGRISGVGEPFGIGEATVTRSVVRVHDELGIGYVLGRDALKARAVAVTDALLQGRWHDQVVADVLEPCRQERRAHLAHRQRWVDPTTVEFETMVRAEG